MPLDESQHHTWEIGGGITHDDYVSIPILQVWLLPPKMERKRGSRVGYVEEVDLLIVSNSSSHEGGTSTNTLSTVVCDSITSTATIRQSQ